MPEKSKGLQVISGVTPRQFIESIFHSQLAGGFPVYTRTPEDGGGVAQVTGQADVFQQILDGKSGPDSWHYCVSYCRRDDGVARRRKQDLVAAAVVVIDDVGSKVRPGWLNGMPVPSFRLETSEGNEQWGFILEEPERDLGKFEALLRELAERGMTDAGSIDAAHVFRLPGSVKAGGVFPARLVSWNPGNRYTVDSLAISASIDLLQADTSFAVRQPQDLERERRDDNIYNWMLEKGMVYGQKNHEGWMLIECPWSGSHSAGTTADYLPLGLADNGDRVFNCHHEHCRDKFTPDLLRWADFMGAPKPDYAEVQESEEERIFRESLQADLARRLADDVKVTDDPDGHFLFQAADFMQRVQPQAELIEGGWLYEEGSAVYFGKPGCGKTNLAVDLTCHLASPKHDQWHQWHMTSGKKLVIYICGEGHPGVRNRIDGWCRVHRMDPAELSLYVTMVSVPFTTPSALPIIQAEIRRIEEAVGVKCALTVIDTIRANYGPGKSLNNDEDMQGFVEGASRVVEHGSRMIIAHSPRATDERPFGSVVLDGDQDIIVKCQKTSEKGEPFEMSIEHVKVRDGIEQEMFLSGDVIELDGENQWGVPHSTLVLKSMAKADQTKQKARRAKEQSANVEYAKWYWCALDAAGISNVQKAFATHRKERIEWSHFLSLVEAQGLTDDAKRPTDKIRSMRMKMEADGILTDIKRGPGGRIESVVIHAAIDLERTTK